jgi:hypothetical protein
VRRAVLVVLLLATACSPSAWQGAETDPTVAVIGDSLVYQADGDSLGHSGIVYEGDLIDELDAAGWRTSIFGLPGAKLSRQLASMAAALDEEPDVLVVALGTNDWNVEAGLEALDEFLDSTPVDCVALVGVAEVPAYDLDERGPVLNAAFAAYGNYTPWAPADGWLVNPRTDPHLTTAGRAGYREVILEAAETCAVP